MCDLTHIDMSHDTCIVMGMSIKISDTVRVTTMTGIRTSGTVLDTHIEPDGSTSYLVEWGCPAYGVPAQIWTSKVRRMASAR